MIIMNTLTEDMQAISCHIKSRFQKWCSSSTVFSCLLQIGASKEHGEGPSNHHISCLAKDIRWKPTSHPLYIYWSDLSLQSSDPNSIKAIREEVCGPACLLLLLLDLSIHIKSNSYETLMPKSVKESTFEFEQADILLTTRVTFLGTIGLCKEN